MKQDLILLRHILRYAKTLNLIDTDPTDGIKAPTSTQGKPDKRPRLTEAEIWQVADTFDPRFRMAVLLGGYTGLRLGELLGLRVEHIDRTTTPYLLDVAWQWDEHSNEFRRPKGNKTRQVPVTPDLWHDLDKHLLQYPASQTTYGTVFATRNGTPILQANFRKIWNQTLTDLSLPHCVPHSLRASFVDIMIDRGIPTHQVQAMAGHQSITITMDVYKGTATTDQLAASIMATASNVKELQQAVNAGAGIMQGTLHSDGRIDIEGLHPDYLNDDAPDADVIGFPQT
jgi:integrase